MKKQRKKSKKQQKRNRRLFFRIILLCETIIFAIMVIMMGSFIRTIKKEPEITKENINLVVVGVPALTPTVNITTPSQDTTTEIQVEVVSEEPEYKYQISKSDKEIMAKLVYQEARGEDFEGQVAVAATVLNRYNYDGDEHSFDNETIESIITQPTQYAPIDGVTTEMLDEVPSCREAVEEACKGTDPTRKVFPEGALFFYSSNTDLISEEQLAIRIGVEDMVIGNHIFHIAFNTNN